MSKKCDSCNKIATINVQRVWVKWEYDYKKDSYSNKFKTLWGVEEPIGEANLHFCEECFRRWHNGAII